jgi:4a-hydroxytetrahydrobiopterin dehydratase
VAEIANAEDHHPNLHLHDYKQVRVVLFTHAINGLSTNDFILAVKIDELSQ